MTPQDAISSDRVRIQTHLGRVLGELRARNVSRLEAPARANRAALIEVLAAYREAGQFPHNINHPWLQMPYFIDHLDTACAVGHLMIASGNEELARTIAGRENNARVHEITTPGVGAWLEENGLTVEEAARIQPGYCNCPGDEVPVCGTDGMTYLNECVATMCAGVDVAHEGACPGGSTGSDWPPATGSGSTSGSTSGDASDSGDDGGDDETGGGKKGCRVAPGSGEPGWLALSLVLLGGLGRWRRREG